MQNLTKTKSATVYALASILLLYALLAMPMISRVGIAFDEQTDLHIADSYSADNVGWLRGIDLDSTNVRLPMYVSWLFFDLTDNDLYSARTVSCLMGLLTLTAVFLFCRREFDEATGLAACFILAISPYFLAFSKIAFTEGDSFITCLTAWLLYCVTSLKRKPTLFWVMFTGLCLGLALSAKASATALVAATIIILLVPGIEAVALNKDSRLPFKHVLLFISAMTLILVVVGCGWLLSGATTIQGLPLGYGSLSDDQLLLHYFSAFAIWSAVLWFFYKNKNRHAGLGWTVLLVLALAAVTFFVLPPVHITNPAIFVALIDIFLSSTDSFTWLFAGEAATLHVLDLLLKSGIVVGIGFCLSIFAALVQWRQRPVFRIPLIFFFVYFSFIVFKMPHAQTFFMMPLLPIAAILLAERLLWLTKRFEIVGLLLIAAALLSTTGDLIRTYPHTHLNGYQWLGARYLAGRSTIGYRSVVQTPSDGLQQAIGWMRSNVARGQRVYYYMWADHILREEFKHSGIDYRTGYHPHPAFEKANYILIHINAIIDDGRGKHNPEGSVYKYRFDMEKIEKVFRKVHSEKRPFGLEVATVWYRKQPYELDENNHVVRQMSEEEGLAVHPDIEQGQGL